MKRPAFQFYPGDWQRDAALRSCSVGARGLWIEMLCVMHQADPYGHLVVNQQGIKPETLARMVGASKRDTLTWLAELEVTGVFSREGDVIVSRRMVRDEALRKVRAEGGKLGGNPALKDKSKVIGKVNLLPNLQPTPSSSVLQSSSSTPLTPLSGKPDDEPPKKLNGASFYPDAEDVLTYLNRSTGKGFEFRNRNGELTASGEKIVQRLRQGYTRQELREVVHAKCEQWKDDDKMHEYLRPATLFSKENFEQYLGELKGAHG